MTNHTFEKERQGWYFLVGGVLAAIVFIVAHCLNWHAANTKPGVLAFLAYVLALALLTLWVRGLDDRRLLAAVMVFVAASVLIYTGWQFIDARYEEFFAFTRELVFGRSIEEYDSRYVANWRIFFLSPLLLMLNAGAAELAIASSAVFLYRKIRHARRE